MLAVEGGQRRTPFRETAEALFVTSACACADAEEAEARFSTLRLSVGLEDPSDLCDDISQALKHI